MNEIPILYDSKFWNSDGVFFMNNCLKIFKIKISTVENIVKIIRFFWN